MAVGAHPFLDAADKLVVVTYLLRVIGCSWPQVIIIDPVDPVSSDADADEAFVRQFCTQIHNESNRALVFKFLERYPAVHEQIFNDFKCGCYIGICIDKAPTYSVVAYAAPSLFERTAFSYSRRLLSAATSSDSDVAVSSRVEEDLSSFSDLSIGR